MTRDNVNLICSVAELAVLFEHTSSLEEFLNGVVVVVADHLAASSCSIYLYDEHQNELVLRATKGLNTDVIGSLKLKLGDGIVGKALLERRPIREANAPSSLYFKTVPEIMEESYAAMLAVPILRGSTRIGVLVVQHERSDYFSDQDSKALLAISVQLAATLESIRLLLELRRIQQPQSLGKHCTIPPKIITGVPGSEGIALGEALIIGRLTDEVVFGDMKDVDEHRTIADLETAISTTEHQLSDLQRQIESEQADIAASFIFGAHLLMLKDNGFLERIRQLKEQGISVSKAVVKTVNEYAQAFASASDPSFQEKAHDVKDLGFRLLRNLCKYDEKTVDYTGLIIVAADLFPSDIIRFATQGAEGIILLGATATAHVSVLARSVGLPVIAVNDDRVLDFSDGLPIILDAGKGYIYPKPSEQLWAKYQGYYRNKSNTITTQRPPSARTCTSDGTAIKVLATINLLRELKPALRFKAAGIGLYRTEFPFIMRSSFPSEEEQFQIYKLAADAMQDMEITFRTLDVGGDKLLDYFPQSNETNPSLGLRAIRFTLRNPDIFEQQLRALLRSRETGALRIMFPLVSSVDDFLQARSILEHARNKLDAEKIAQCTKVEIGAMIELPSAVEIIDELATEADFLCIGTNDLVQYMLAVDRTNALVSDLFVPHHPAVLRALKKIVLAAQRHDIDVSACGEMVSDPQMLKFLIGIGIRKISVNPDIIPEVQACISEIDANHARKLADELVAMGKLSDIESRLRQPC